MEKETLEKAALSIVPDKSTPGWIDSHSAIERIGFIKGAKWQAERMYSEEEVKQAFIDGSNNPIEEDDSYGTQFDKYMNEWFEQFKKK